MIKEQIESCFKINNKPLYYQKENESLSEATVRIFQSGMVFESKQKLKDLIHSFADFWYFCIATDGCKYTCNRAGKYNNKRLLEKHAQRQHKRNFKCDCKWKIGFRFKNVTDRSGSVVITTICPYHTFPCNPSQNQYTLARKVSGQLAKYTEYALTDLVNRLYTDKYISASSIRAILKRVYPGGQELNNDQINNARVRAQILVDDARAQGHDPTNIVSQSRITNLIRKLDFDSENIFDKAVKASNNLFYGTLNCHDGNTKLLNLLYGLASHDKGFTYKIFFNINNKISGFMWMTSTMRSNFERFGTFLSLDAMKRRMNIHLWSNQKEDTCK